MQAKTIIAVIIILMLILFGTSFLLYTMTSPHIKYIERNCYAEFLNCSVDGNNMTCRTSDNRTLSMTKKVTYNATFR